MEIVTMTGAVAAIASTASFLPQAVKILRTRDTSSISTGMYAITVSGFALWTTYGIMLGKWPLIVSNSISLLLSAFILLMTLVSPREREKIVESIAPQDAVKRKRRKPVA
jgi:MtN3 and saliva related transmembrane protein